MPNDSQRPLPFCHARQTSLFSNPFFAEHAAPPKLATNVSCFSIKIVIILNLFNFYEKFFCRNIRQLCRVFTPSTRDPAKSKLFQHGEIWHTGCKHATNLFPTKHTVRRPWLHPCLLLLSAAPSLHKSTCTALRPAAASLRKAPRHPLASFTSPAPDQPGPASPGRIGYASLERGQLRPRSLWIRL
jgi:hypothetical protein